MGLFSSLSFRKRSQPEPAAAPEPAAETAVAPEPEAEAVSPVAPELASVQLAAPAPMPEAKAAVPACEPEPEPAPLPVLSAEVRAQAEELVRRVVQELPAFITVAVVEAATGRILAGRWAGHSGGAVEVAAANAEVVRQTRQCLAALQVADSEQINDVLITLRHQLHLLRVLPQADWLLYLAVRTQDTNPALARAVLQGLD